MGRNRLLPIFLVVFVDLMGFGIILPLLPFYAETFGASPLEVGLLATVYAAGQLFGAPVLGRLSDKYGRRPLLLVSIAGTALGFFVLGLAQSLAVIFLSRVVSGLFGGNISVAQAYIADVTDERNRAKGMGLVGAAFGLGFIFGPALGGVLSVNGFALPAFAAAGLATVNFVAVALWLPESLSPERRAAIAAMPRPAFSAGALVAALGRPRVGPLLQVRFFFGLAFAAFQGIFALWAQYHLGLNAQATGLVMAYIGALSIVVQGVAIGWLTARSSDDGLILAAIALMATSLFAWAFAFNVVSLLILLVPLAMAAGVLNTVVNSALSKAVRREEVGGTLGLGASVESLTRVLGPLAGGWLLQSLGAAAPGLFGAAVLLGLLPYAWRHLQAQNEPPEDGSGEPRLRPLPVTVSSKNR
jgi:DHA1 family tetracycline resistance protein-like MFS transporter